MKILWFSFHFLSILFLQGLSGDNFPITVSIVLSGQYEDDLDNCEEIVYTGQGGNNLLGDKRQIGHQEMKRGNLGLKARIYVLMLYDILCLFS